MGVLLATPAPAQDRQIGVNTIPHDSGARANPDDIAPSHQQQSAPIRTETIVVPVRVVVHDSNGNAIGSLKKGDFKLFQDGKQQEILNFTPVNAAVRGPVSGAAANAASANSSTASLIARPVAPATRFIALFFDDVHVELPDLMRARNAAKQYVETLVQPTDRVALLTVSGQGQQDFTTDTDALVRKLNAILPRSVTAGDKDSMNGCPPMDFAEADAIVNQDMAQVFAIAARDALDCAYDGQKMMMPEAADLAKRTADHLAFEYDEQTEASFRRIKEVVRRISILPGQRDVVLISPGFLTTDHDQELSDIIDQAVRDNVIVNTLDASGLSAPEVGGDIAEQPLPQSPGAQSVLDSFRMTEESRRNFVLIELSDATGGRAFINNNDFNAGMRALAATPEAYYLLTYSPHDLKANGHYHHLKVTLNVKGNLVVEARHGFYAPARNETAAQAARREIDDAIFSQQERHDLPVNVQTRVESTASGGKQLDIYADMDIAQLHFEKANGVNREGLTLVAAIFDSNGNYVDGTQKIVTFNFKDATLAEFSKTGASSEVTLSVKPGTYFLRFVARDSNDKHMSAQNVTVDVPN